MIFVDTSFFYALASANDPDHQRVRQVFESFAGRRLREVLVTSNHTVFETIRLTRRRRGHRAAVEMGEQLYAEKMARIDWTTPEEERAAFDYMVKYHDKDYSPVDCVSFVVMERLKITEALAVDSHFTHRFIARPGPSTGSGRSR